MVSIKRVNSKNYNQKLNRPVYPVYSEIFNQIVDDLENQLNDITTVTYTSKDVQELIAAKNLTPGKTYVINDFQTVHTIQYTDETNIGPREQIAVQASGVDTLDPTAVSITHDNEQLTIVWNPEKAIDINFDMDLAFYNLHRYTTSYASSWNGKLEFKTVTGNSETLLTGVGLTDGAISLREGVHPVSLRITAIADSNGIDELELLSNPDGTLEGNGTGTIDYASGTINLEFNEAVRTGTTVTITYYTADSLLTKGLIIERYRPESSLFDGFDCRIPYDWRVVRFRRWAFSFDTGSDYPYMIGEPKTYCLSNPIANYIGTDPNVTTRFDENIQFNGSSVNVNFNHTLNDFTPNDLNDYEDYFTAQQPVGHPETEVSMVGKHFICQYFGFNIPRASTLRLLGSILTSYNSSDSGRYDPTRTSLYTNSSFVFNNIVVRAESIALHILNTEAALSGLEGNTIVFGNFTFIGYATTSLNNYPYVLGQGYECSVYNRDEKYNFAGGDVGSVNPLKERTIGYTNILLIGWSPFINKSLFYWTNTSIKHNQVFGLFNSDLRLQDTVTNVATFIDLYHNRIIAGNSMYSDFSYVVAETESPLKLLVNGEGTANNVSASNPPNNHSKITGPNSVIGARFICAVDDWPSYAEAPFLQNWMCTNGRGVILGTLGSNNLQRVAPAVIMYTKQLHNYINNNFEVAPTNAFSWELVNTRRDGIVTSPLEEGESFVEGNEGPVTLRKIGLLKKQIKDDGGIKYIELDLVEAKNFGELEILPETNETENTLNEIRLLKEADGIALGTAFDQAEVFRAIRSGFIAVNTLSQSVCLYPTAGLTLNISLGTSFSSTFYSQYSVIKLDGDNTNQYAVLGPPIDSLSSPYFKYNLSEVVGTVELPVLTSLVNGTEIPFNILDTVFVNISLAANNNLEFTKLSQGLKASGVIANSSAGSITITVINDARISVINGTTVSTSRGISQTFDIPATNNVLIEAEVTSGNLLILKVTV